MNQQSFEFVEDSVASRRGKRSGAFTDNMALPIHRWFRYSAGFSAEWVAKVIAESDVKPGEFVFDPFAGSGTTLVAAQAAGISAAGAEHHEFVNRIAKAKLCWPADENVLVSVAERMLREADRRIAPKPETSSDLLLRCYTPRTLSRLEALKQAYSNIRADPEIMALLWLALTAILRECSGAGTAQWQYILPNKSKQRVSAPFAAFAQRIHMFAADMRAMKRLAAPLSDVRLFFSDARTLGEAAELKGRVKLVLTSPPYPNNFDYADATRLEMTFWGDVASWGDLQNVIRHRLIRSCSQHSAAEKLTLDDLLNEKAISPIADELGDVCRQLEAVRQTKGGKKSYHTMVAAYFIDLARTWDALLPLCTKDARVCFVIGDSAPYGVYVPVDKWLGTLAIHSGFRAVRFEPVRERNVKWKNRKHRVPLKEGRLWVER